MTNEWLETDGLGGFASGSSDTLRTRRYHAILLTATTPPTGRCVLVNGFDAWIQTPTGNFAISSQHYLPDVIHPDGFRRIESFRNDPWPTWIFRLEDGTRIQQEIIVKKGSPLTLIAFKLLENTASAILSMRPFLSGRDYHSMHHENASFRFEPEIHNEHIQWHPYDGLPVIHAYSNGSYHHEPAWYRNFLYSQEQERGLDATEDLATPGVISWDLTKGEAFCIFSTETISDSVEIAAQNIRSGELKRRLRFDGRLESAADAYIVQRKKGKTIVAGYPWFTDWGRDTFIALRGLCFATGDFDTARDILLGWAGTVSEGMLPNRFPDQGGEPEYNSVDASLWYAIAVYECLQMKKKIPATERQTLLNAVDAILTGYEKGTRFGIRMDKDGLIAAGQKGYQLTWMDAKIGDWVVTPRIGKPIEIQALWLNALRFAGTTSAHRQELYELGIDSFSKKFWNANDGFLYDVIDDDHEAGKNDLRFRPNQIFAVGGLPFAILTGEKARLVVDAVENRLLTPLGLRSLAPGSPDYAPHYEGGPRERDGVYHQGTVWPWLMGAFVEAWLRVRRETENAKNEARVKFLEPLLRHLNESGLGHVSEIGDAESPFTPRGCPFQAWSVGEVIRIARMTQ
jgi:predicted glycogen debranching enzyme